ncbi:Hypothetical predicted protein [Cloeon dipterum]|uniref:CCR4-NOT transcription complex subunit 1 n=1 Tax=Cloeon dipterum TaxID=197152 RepID=A0A8S1CZA4_9INSE|nr:Hypothetical predicted protein [Cloeon dipterum]
MNLDSLSFALSQINYLVANLTKKNYKTSVQELSCLIALHGEEADRHLLRSLFSYIEVGATSDKGSQQILLLQQECAALLSKSRLVANFCYAFEQAVQLQKSPKSSQQLLSLLSRLLRFSPIQEVVLGLSLLHSSNSDTKSQALGFLKQKFPEFVRSVVEADPGASSDETTKDFGTEALHFILANVSALSSDTFGVNPDTFDLFLEQVCKNYSPETVPEILAPFLYKSTLDISVDMPIEPPSKMMDNSLADLIIELGYGCCSSAAECRRQLSSLGREITSAAIARVLGAMVRTHTGLDKTSNFYADKEKPESIPLTWNVEIFVQAIKEMAPNLRWDDVVRELDFKEFRVIDRQGLTLLMTALRSGLQAQGFHPDLFPIEHIYRAWENAEGQLSLVQQILKSPDVFSFTDYTFRPVVIDTLKVPPDSDCKDANTWRSLDLLETLLYLCDRGLCSPVTEILKPVLSLYPDVLALGLLQASTQNAQKSSMQLRKDVLSALLPTFLANHSNSAIILHTAWHAQSNAFQPVVMAAMAEYYIRGENDQTRLTRILDVAQDLKGLSMLLAEQTYPFVIDLACLASRRGFLKLDKWLNDKMIQQGEPFISACVKFLQRRTPQVLGGIVKDDTAKAAQLPQDQLAQMVMCLQAFEKSVSHDLSEMISTTVANCKILLGNPRQTLPGAIRPRHSIDSAFNPAGINAQLFSTPQVDSLASIGSSLSSLSLGGGVGSALGAHTASAFSMPGSPGPLVSTNLGPLLSNSLGSQVSTPASPSRIIGAGVASTSPFNPLLPLNAQLHTGGPVGSQITSTASSQGMSQTSLNPIGGPPRLETSSDKGESLIFSENTHMLSKEVEEEANSYFKRIYNHPPHPTLSIDETLEMLRKFQTSPNQREKDVFTCMLRNLFEEYKFFPQYPDKELYITAQLFGGIIERGLVSYLALGYALRYVLDALKQSYQSKMYNFGITALDRFKGRLKEYQKYCEYVSQLPNFKSFPPTLIEYVESGMRSVEPSVTTSNSPAPNVAANLPPSVSTTSSTAVKSTIGSGIPSRPSIAMATNIDTLLVATEKEEKIIAPPEVMQDKIAFIFNNLSQLNLQSKCDDLKDIITDEYWPWVAQYLVMKRASIEFNFHALYSNFLDVLKIPDLNKMVVRETFRNIKVLLHSDKKGIANFSDRSLLKNLGHWLGMLTLAKNKPILQNDMDLKALLAEAYLKGQQELLYVVPFVAKVLEACSKSKVFRPPNPWTMALMNVLAELHQEQDLKLNLKFEIEVLCKNLNIDVYDLKPTVYLKDQDKLRTLEIQLSHPAKPEPQISTGSVVTIPTSAPAPAPQPPTTTTEEMPQQMVSAAATSSAATSTGIVATAGTPTPALPSGPPEPRFAYHEIQANNFAALTAHIVVPPLPLFQAQPSLKQYIKGAIERAVQEWMAPVLDRSIKISLTTCEQIIKKDFALDPDPDRMRAAAHHMVRNLTAGMAMITCRDSLLVAICSNLKSAFGTQLLSATASHKELVDHTATMVAQENIELACAFIQKTAIEKAIIEIDKRLANELEMRKLAQNEGRRYCDSLALKYQAERMPEQIRLKVGMVTPQQMTVYEEFARNIPGFQPLPEREALMMPPPSFGTETVATAIIPRSTEPIAVDPLGPQFEKVRLELEQWIQTSFSGLSNTLVSQLHSLHETMMLVRSSRDPTFAASLVQRVLENLHDCTQAQGIEQEALNRFRDINLCCLKAMQDPAAFGIQFTNKQVARSLMDGREEVRYNLDIVNVLVHSHLLNLALLDSGIAQAMDNGNNFLAVSFGMSLVQLFLIDDRNVSVAESDLFNTIETLFRISMSGRQVPDGLNSLIEILRANQDHNLFSDRAMGGPTSHIHSGIVQAREFDDPQGLLEKTEYLLREWVNIFHSPSASRDPTKAFSVFVHQMNVHGILKTDDLITRFFRLSTQMCVDLCYRALADQNSSTPVLVRTKCFHTLDAFVRLIALLVKHSGDASNNATKVNLLNKVLGIVAGVLLQDHEVHLTEFQQLPYHRIFIILFLELNTPEPVLEVINFQVLTAFCHTLHILRPSHAPAFAYAWLELVSHRVFIGRMLAITPQQKGWGMYAQLLIDLFKFLAPFLRNAELSKPVALFYKGTLRVLLVLLHDFPEFLCDYHYSFCDVIPPNCIQMRNLILSAFPRNMRLPDPFTPNLKVDMLQEINHAPRVLSNIASLIQPASFKKDLDNYLKARAPVTFLSELRGHLQVSHEPGLRYNIKLMNALVLYVGTQAIAHIRSKTLQPNMTTIAHSAHMDIFQNLAVDLDTEGRYLFLNAIANQLRYPNSHTHYFSCTLLYLFAEANSEAIQEQITRVLLERLIVNRPHPWGLLITFIELIKNPIYKFWNHEFVHCAPEIEKLFESVARSCMVQKAQAQQNSEMDISGE